MCQEIHLLWNELKLLLSVVKLQTNPFTFDSFFLSWYLLVHGLCALLFLFYGASYVTNRIFFALWYQFELKFQCRWRFAPAFIQMFWHLYNSICGTKKRDLNIVRHRQAWFIQIPSMKCWTYFHISFVEPRVHFKFH